MCKFRHKQKTDDVNIRELLGCKFTIRFGASVCVCVCVCVRVCVCASIQAIKNT